MQHTQDLSNMYQLSYDSYINFHLQLFNYVYIVISNFHNNPKHAVVDILTTNKDDSQCSHLVKYPKWTRSGMGSIQPIMSKLIEK